MALSTAILSKFRAAMQATALVGIVLFGIWTARKYIQRAYMPNTFRSMAVAALSEKTEVLFLGTCHVAMSVDPALYGPHVMNIATFNMDYPRLQQITRKH